jgi:sterol desaturase/sphingolipid hydroxylase (fatty acid hydroxylase superfamily)
MEDILMPLNARAPSTKAPGRRASAGQAGNGNGKPIPGWLSGAIVLGAFAAIVWAETRQPLRRQEHKKVRRDVRNLAVAAMSALTLQTLEKPVVEPLSRLVEKRRWGLLKRFDLPAPVETAMAIVLMDYTLYVWHVLTHKVPFLWRFHVVHHCDLDLDASTALRFHFTEMALSVPWRAAQVGVLGIAPRPLSIWQTFLFVSILFHHSNLRMPQWLERRLSPFIVTPRMHGIHHSIIEEETNSNWSSGFTIWDRLHRTLRLDIPQHEIEIGVPAYRSPDQVTLPRLVEMPFTEQPPSGLLPSGEKPARHTPSGSDLA